MSKIKLDNINFDNDDFVVKLDNETSHHHSSNVSNEEEIKSLEEHNSETLIDEIEQKIIDEAKLKAQEILEQAQNEIKQKEENLELEKEKIIDEAKLKAQEILEQAQNEIKQKEENLELEKEKLINEAQTQIEQERIEQAKKGYDEGYQDASLKFIEENEEKIKKFEKFISHQFEIKEKIIKSASFDIASIISNIAKKVILKEISPEIIDNIIKKTITLFEKKEDITIILSEDYAKLLLDFQNKNLDNEEKINFENFKQYQGFEVVYNSKFAPDTIIIENLKERYDASINSQLDILIRNIYQNFENGNIDLEEYQEKSETNEAE